LFPLGLNADRALQLKASRWASSRMYQVIFISQRGGVPLSYVLALILIAILAATIFALIWFWQKSPMFRPATDKYPVESNTPANRIAPELAIKKRFFRREVVEAKVKSSFQEHETAEILRLLDEYVPIHGGGPERVQLAILKLSNGNLDELRTLLEEAKRDSREAIVPAEYPGQSRDGFVGWEKLSQAEKERVSSEDNRQYMAWLENDAPRI
jgi:hypothetical protein